jgi:hypothetical protein
MASLPIVANQGFLLLRNNDHRSCMLPTPAGKTQEADRQTDMGPVSIVSNGGFWYERCSTSVLCCFHSVRRNKSLENRNIDTPAVCWTVSALRKSLYGLWLITGSLGIWLAAVADVGRHLPPRDGMSANQPRILHGQTAFLSKTEGRQLFVSIGDTSLKTVEICAIAH